MKQLIRNLILVIGLLCLESFSLAAQNFDMGGIYYKVVSPETNEVKVIAHPENSYEQTSLLIPESVMFNNIEYSVIGIEPMAFINNQNLISLTIEGSISIGEKAFYDCINLKECDFGKTCEIQNEAFAFCSSLEHVILPGECQKFGTGVFHDCTSLLTASWKDFNNNNIPSIKTLPERTFENCSSLLYANLPLGLTVLENRCFANCDNFKLSSGFYDNVTVIGEECFWGCNGLLVVDKVDLPNVAYISNRAFANCENLTQLNLPESLINLGSSITENCKNLEIISIYSDKLIPDVKNNFIGAESKQEIAFAINPEMKDEYFKQNEGYFKDYKTLNISSNGGSVFINSLKESYDYFFPIPAQFIDDSLKSLILTPVDSKYALGVFYTNYDGKNDVKVDFYFNDDLLPYDKITESESDIYKYYFFETGNMTEDSDVIVKLIPKETAVSIIADDNGFGNKRICVYDLSGRLLLSEVEMSAVESLPRGTYILKSALKAIKISR